MIGVFAFLKPIATTIGPIFSGVGAAVGSFAGNALGHLTVAAGKGAVAVGKGAIKLSVDITTDIEIKLEENKIKDAKYKIGNMVFEKKESFSNTEIESEFEDIEAYLQEKDKKIKEYKEAEGNVNELINEIEKFNESYEILEQEKNKVMNNVEEIKDSVANTLSKRHKDAEQYIKDVVKKSKLLDDEIDTKVLMEELEEI